MAITRNIRAKVFYRKAVLKNLQNLEKKTCARVSFFVKFFNSFFTEKKTTAQVFS